MRLVAFCVLEVLISSGCGQPVREAEVTKTVVGTLPDGTRYALRVPARLEVDEVDGVAAVPVWADGPSEAVGVRNFVFTKSLPSDTAFENTTIVDDRLIVPAGSWALVRDLYDHSIGREADLAMLQAREESGLPVLELPPSLRFPQPNELPVEMEVMYRDIRVVQGCARHGLCSPNGEFMVVPIESDTDLSACRLALQGATQDNRNSSPILDPPYRRRRTPVSVSPRRAGPGTDGQVEPARRATGRSLARQSSSAIHRFQPLLGGTGWGWVPAKSQATAPPFTSL